MTFLIVNADDFGQTIGVNEGIVEAYQEGIVTSATVMANGGAFEHAVGLAIDNPGLGVGVHLNFVEGQPVTRPSQVGSLLGGRGTFLSKFALVRRHLSGRLRLRELKVETEAQIDRVLGAGLMPTHVDAHKHIHAYPAFFGLVADVAQSRGIGAIRLPWERLSLLDLLARPGDAFRTTLLNTASRISRRTLRRGCVQSTDVFAGTLRTGRLSTPWLIEWMSSLPDGTVELMVHPGKCDKQLVDTGTRLTTQREAELRALTDPCVVEGVKAARITLIHFGQIPQPRTREPLTT